MQNRNDGNVIRLNKNIKYVSIEIYDDIRMLYVWRLNIFFVVGSSFKKN